MSVLGFGVVSFARMAVFDYAANHPGADIADFSGDPVADLALWQERYGTEKRGDQVVGPRLLLNEALKLVSKVERVVDATREHLPADVVVAADNLLNPFGGHTETFIEMVEAPAFISERGYNDWLCLVIVSDARQLADVLRRYGSLPDLSGASSS
jgi:hypothetical protein